MLIAQAMGEYGGMSGLASSLQSWLTRAQEFIGGLGTKEYTVIALVAVVGLFLLRRK